VALCAQAAGDRPDSLLSDRRHRPANLERWWLQRPGGGRGAGVRRRDLRACAAAGEPCRPQAHEHGAKVMDSAQRRSCDPALPVSALDAACVCLVTNRLVGGGFNGESLARKPSAKQAYRLVMGLEVVHHRWRGVPLDSMHVLWAIRSVSPVPSPQILSFRSSMLRSTPIWAAVAPAGVSCRVFYCLPPTRSRRVWPHRWRSFRSAPSLFPRRAGNFRWWRRGGGGFGGAGSDPP